MKVLITGGLGFIGTNLTMYLLKNTDWGLVLFDNYSNHVRIVKEKRRLRVVKGDITDAVDVDRVMQGCDMVVNLAGQTSVVCSMDDPFFDYQVNIGGLLNVLDSAREYGIARVVHASSAAASGCPVSPYGASKSAGELYCRVYAASFGVPCVVTRFSNVYGPYCDKKNSVVAKFIRHSVHDEPLVVHGSGNQTRDFVYVDDVCQGLYHCLAKSLPDVFQCFQFGSGVQCSVNELVGKLQLLYPGVSVVSGCSRPGDKMDGVVDISDANLLLWYQPMVFLEEGLKKTIEYLT